MPDLRVTDNETGKVYEIDVHGVLEDLTGDETLEVEEFIGGWENFDETGDSARSVILLYFLAKRGNDPSTKLKDVLKEKGILFGDRIELEDLDSPPAQAAEEAATRSTPSDDSETSGVGTSQNATA